MKATKPKIFGLILAGGYSQRMGRDKAYLEFHGKPQIEHAFDLLKKYCAKVFISIRPKQKLSFPHLSHVIPSAPTVITAKAGIQNLSFLIEDIHPFIDIGPLGGILSAMKEYPHADWLVMACDLPFVTDETIQTLLALRDPQKQATAFISIQDAQPEPLCAIWEGHAYGSFLKLFNERIHCPRKILMKSNTRLIKQNNPHWLDNINTPEEYEIIKNDSVIARSEATKQSLSF